MLMIPDYPKFSRIELSHKEQLTNITSRFVPYSDFNFTSLFCWNINGDAVISLLNNNLVVGMPDYITGQPIVTFVGTDRVDETVDTLLKDNHELKLVPEDSVKAIRNKKQFSVVEDTDQFDYVYDLGKQADLLGSIFRNKRKRLGKFMRERVEELEMSKIAFNNPSHSELINRIFEDWAKDRKREKDDTENERKAIKRLLDNSSNFNLTGIFIKLGERHVGFSINEVLGNHYAICHFQKTMTSYDYLDIFLTNLVAKELKHFGCAYVNWEQDLGIAGLRELKSSYMPDIMLRKYTVTRV